MVAVDTNLVIRLLTLDDEEQAARAKSLFASNRVFLPKTVLLEAEWVLRRLYGFEHRKVAEALRKLIALENSETEDSNAVRTALDWAEAGLDFADALHLASSLRAKRFATFDTRFKSRTPHLPGTAIEVP